MDDLTKFVPEYYEKNIYKTIPHYTKFQKETIDLVRTTNPDCNIWLDTGCGTGSLMEIAFRIFNKCSFYLNDPSEDMLQYAKARLSKYPTGSFSFFNYTTADLPTTEVPECDVITAIQSHHYMNPEERTKATKKCYDMLKNGGTFITFENTAPSSENGISVATDRLRRFQLENGKEAIDIENNLKRYDTAYFPITISEHLKMLKECGFKTVELFWASYLQAGFYAIK